MGVILKRTNKQAKVQVHANIPSGQLFILYNSSSCAKGALNKHEHVAEEREAAQHNLHYGRVLPWGGGVRAQEAAAACNTRQQDPGPETLLADEHF